MLKRFVITEFFRKPDEDYGHLKIWRYRTTGHEKRKFYFPHQNQNDWVDMFFDTDGKSHREHGQPAVIHSSGYEKYYFHGKLHRGHFEPAVIEPNGRKEYWVYGEKRFETLALTKNK